MIIVSADARNRHTRGDTFLVVPLTPSIHKDAHGFLPAGETGLRSDFAARGENVTVVRKDSLIDPRTRLRQLADKHLPTRIQSERRDELLTMRARRSIAGSSQELCRNLL